jgi:hypothetical protein
MDTPNEHVADRLDDYLHEVLSPEEAARIKEHCEACPTCRTALEEARKRLAALQAVPASEASEQQIQAVMKKIDSHERSRRRVRKWFLWGTGGVAAAAAAIIAAVHIYYARLTPSPVDLEVFGQRVLLRDGHASLRIRLVDRASQTPLAGIPVDVQFYEPEAEKGGTLSLTRFVTDGHGTGQPSFSVPEWIDQKTYLRVVAHTKDGPEIITWPITFKRSGKVMLSSDKPVYQPGQTIHLRALALRKTDLLPLADQEATFSIRDPRGNVIFKHKAKTSKYGITAADCPLAGEILEGPYSITARVGDVQSKLTVTVKKYVLPKFKVNIDLDRPFYQPGQKVRGTVQADYFFGQPVANGAVTIEVKTVPEQLNLLTKQQVTADGKGHARFEWDLPDNLVGREQEGEDARFSFQVTVRDSAGQKHARTVSRLVTARPLRIEIIPEGGALVRGLANRIYFFATYADGKPAAQVRLHVMEAHKRLITNRQGVAAFEWTPDSVLVAFHIRAEDRAKVTADRTVWLRCGRHSADFLIRTDKAVYNSGDTLRLVALGDGQEPVFVDFLKDGQTIFTETIDMKDGRGEYDLDLSPGWFGTLEICAYRFDSGGVPLRKTHVLYILPGDQLKVRAKLDAPSYLPGARAAVQLTVKDRRGKPAPGALSLAAVDEAVFSVLDQRPGMEQTFFTLEQELMRPIYAVYSWSPDMALKVPPKERNQFEQALFARTVTVDGKSRRDWEEEGEQSEAVPEESMEEERPRDQPHSFTGSSYRIKKHEAKVDKVRGLKNVHDAWTILAVFLGVVGYSALWCFVRPVVLVMALHGILLPLLCVATIPFGGCGILPYMTSKDKDKKEEAPAEGRFGRQDGTSGDTLGPDFEDSGDGSVRRVRSKAIDVSRSMAAGRTKSQAIRVRSYFPETLLWRPQLITDDKGRAHIDLKLADSITTWRLTASAVSAGRLGATQAGIKVFKPFFVDLDLPVALTRGDEIAIPVVVYNYLDRPQHVNLHLDAAPSFKLLEPSPVKELDLDARKVRSTSFRLRVLRAGTHSLRLTARGQGEADAIQRTVEVVPDGRRVENVWSGTLERPVPLALSVLRDSIPDSTRAILKIYPSSFSQLVEGLDAIFEMPYGCFEQTSSTTYPNILALDYLRRIKKSAPQVEAKARQYIHLGYQRLLSFEVSGGGFSLYGQKPADPVLTAYGLREFQDMARVHDVDPDLIERSRKWLLEQRNDDGSWSPGRHGWDEGDAGEGDAGRLQTTAYIALAVFAHAETRKEESQKTWDFLLAHPPGKIRDPYVLALVCNALLTIDPKAREIAPYLDRLDSLKQPLEDGKFVCWKQAPGARTAFYGQGRGGSIETTALAVLAMIPANQYPETTRRALAWLIRQKDPRGTWHSTQATVLALKALVACTGKPLGGDRKRRIELTWDNGRKRSIVIPADQAEVMKQIDLTRYLDSGRCRFTLADRSGAASGYQVTLRYHMPWSDPKKPEPLAIGLAFQRTKIRENHPVRVTATAVNRTKQPAPMVMVELPIPAGFRFVDMTPVGDKYQVTPQKVIVYLRDLQPKKPVEIRYLLRAAMPGKVAVPAARVYEYYDPDKQGLSSTNRGKEQEILTVE